MWPFRLYASIHCYILTLSSGISFNPCLSATENDLSVTVLAALDLFELKTPAEEQLLEGRFHHVIKFTVLVEVSTIYVCKEDIETVRKRCGIGLYCKRVQSYDTKCKIKFS